MPHLDAWEIPSQNGTVNFMSYLSWFNVAVWIALCVVYFERSRWESWLMLVGIGMGFSSLFSDRVVMLDQNGMPTSILDALLGIWMPLFGQMLFFFGLLIAGFRYRACRKRAAELELLLEEIQPTHR